MYVEPENSNLLCFVRYFHQFTKYQKSEWYFFAIDAWESEVKLKKKMPPDGRAEIKKMLNLQKVTFLISTDLPPGDTFELCFHYSHLWAPGKKSVMQIFDKLCIDEIDETEDLTYIIILLHIHSVKQTSHAERTSQTYTCKARRTGGLINFTKI